MRKFLSGLNAVKKYLLNRKMLRTKIARNKISSKKLNGRISLVTLGIEPGGPKDLHF